MSRPIGTYKKDTQLYADYLDTISNRNSKNKARHILALFYERSDTIDSKTQMIALFCFYLDESGLRQSSIRTYLLELLKYILFLDSPELLNALYYCADSSLSDMSHCKLWAKHKPQNLTLPSD
jgi:hypothetical protein